MGNEPNPTLTDAQVKQIAAPVIEAVVSQAAARVQIVVDEATNGMKKAIDEKAKTVQEQMARAGASLNGDVRDNPNFKRWQEGQEGPGPVGSVPAPRVARRGIGRAFVESEQYKRFVDGNDAQGSSLILKLDASLATPRARTAGISTVADLQAVHATYYDQDIVGLPQREIRTKDLFDVVPTQDEAVKYVRMTGFDNQATAVAMLPTDPTSPLTAEAVREIAARNWVQGTNGRCYCTQCGAWDHDGHERTCSFSDIPALVATIAAQARRIEALGAEVALSEEALEDAMGRMMGDDPVGDAMARINYQTLQGDLTRANARIEALEEAEVDLNLMWAQMKAMEARVPSSEAVEAVRVIVALQNVETCQGEDLEICHRAMCRQGRQALDALRAAWPEAWGAWPGDGGEGE